MLLSIWVCGRMRARIVCVWNIFKKFVKRKLSSLRTRAEKSDAAEVSVGNAMWIIHWITAFSNIIQLSGCKNTKNSRDKVIRTVKISFCPFRHKYSHVWIKWSKCHSITFGVSLTIWISKIVGFIWNSRRKRKHSQWKTVCRLVSAEKRHRNNMNACERAKMG